MQATEKKKILIIEDEKPLSHALALKLTHEGLCTSSSNSGGDDTLLATWEELEMIADKKQGCYSIYDDGSKPWHVSTISKSSGIPASLCPPLQSSGAPTVCGIAFLVVAYLHYYCY